MTATAPAKSTARPRLLVIDDDQSILQALRRVHGRRYELELFDDPRAAVASVQDGNDFMAVFCDYQMPGLNGAECLAQIQTQNPEISRVLLTGNNDLETAVDAINRGAIFRFLRKPCDADAFLQCADDAVRQSQLMRTERDLLENTLRGMVTTLTQILALTQPTAFGRADRVRQVLRRLMAHRGEPLGWELETAAMLASIGLVAVPPDLLAAAARGDDLNAAQRAIIGRHPTFGGKLLEKIPRLEGVTAIVRYQRKHFDGGGLPGDDVQGVHIPLGARLLFAVQAYDDELQRGYSHDAAVASMQARGDVFDPRILASLREMPPENDTSVPTSTPITRLAAGVVLDQDVIHQNGTLLVPKGQTVNESLLERLRNYADLGHIPDSVRVLETA